MQFDNAYQIAAQTPMTVLREAWGTCDRCTTLGAQNKRPLTIREAGALAELRGLKLEDVIAF